MCLYQILDAGELKRIDCLIDELKRAEREFEEGGLPEEKCAELRERRKALAVERAGHANRELHIRLLLEILDAATPEGSGADWPPECADYEEFFERTRREKIVDFEEAIRHVEKIVVQEKGLEVVFKAGISIKV